MKRYPDLERDILLAIENHSMMGISQSNVWVPQRLTMSEYEYLDTIRDPEIWRQTKEGADKVSSRSIETLSQLARGFIRTQVKKLTGEDMDV